MPGVGNFVRWSLILGESIVDQMGKFYLNHICIFVHQLNVYYRYF